MQGVCAVRVCMLPYSTSVRVCVFAVFVEMWGLRGARTRVTGEAHGADGAEPAAAASSGAEPAAAAPAVPL